MKIRVVIAVLIALVVGVGGGYAVASSQEEQTSGPVAPRPATVGPVPASPRLPVAEIQPDPDDPTLLTDIDLVPQTLEAPGDEAAGVPTYSMTLPVPVGWGRRDGTAKWTYTVDGSDSYPYGLRVQLIAGQDVSVATAVRSRTSALVSAEAQGNLTDLEVTPTTTGDGFESSYIDEEGFQTVSIERFYGGDDPSHAVATVAAYGRQRDRAGLVDLLALVSKDLRTEERPAGDQ